MPFSKVLYASINLLVLSQVLSREPRMGDLIKQITCKILDAIAILQNKMWNDILMKTYQKAVSRQTFHNSFATQKPSTKRAVWYYSNAKLSAYSNDQDGSPIFENNILVRKLSHCRARTHQPSNLIIQGKLI